MDIGLDEMRAKKWFQSYPGEIRQLIENGYRLPELPAHLGLKSSAKYYPETTALIYEPENFIVNYAELLELSTRFASGLQSRFGVQKGDMVAICSRNCPEVAIAIFAISMIGAVYVGCNPLLIKKELQYQLTDTKAKLIIISDEQLAVVQELMAEKSTSLETVIVSSWDQELKMPLLQGETETYQAPYVRYSKVFSDQPLKEPPIEAKSDLFTILYTSGTTSYPKGVMITHYNVVSSCIIYGSSFTGNFPELDQEGLLKFTNNQKDLSMNWDYPLRHGIDWVLSVPPWTHAMGFVGRLMYPMMASLTVIQLPNFNVDALLNMIQRYKIAFGGGAPMMISTILSRSDIEQQDISCIRTWAAGGAPVPLAIAENFEKRISGVISEAWTLTEGTMTSTKNYANRRGLKKTGSVGVPVPFTDVKVVDPQTGTQEMPIGEEGELIQKGPSVAQGYLNKPEDTRQSFRDGWLFTGDLGKMDKDGFFYITGRKKELIKYKGYNIAPSMLEEILYQHPGVHTCVVLPLKDPVVGEKPIAFVQLKQEKETTEKELMEFANTKVAPYKKIRGVRFMETLPTLASGKVDRRTLNHHLDDNNSE